MTGQQHGGSANKPFITEYKLAFKDPTPFLRKGTQPGSKKKAGASVAAAKQQQQLKEKQQMLQQHQLQYQQHLQQQQQQQSATPLFPFASSAAIKEVPQTQRNGPISKKDLLWGPGTHTNPDSELTSLTLPAMMNTPPVQPSTFRRRRVLAQQNVSIGRYNILSGTEIQGEPYSGYKEGRRAVIQTFARIDLTTNARTPGYNIISAKDYDQEVLKALSI